MSLQPTTAPIAIVRGPAPSRGPDSPNPPGSAGRRGLLALAVLGTGLRLGLIWMGWCDNRVVADDAFYYFTIARHLAAGHGATFDGLAATNGFHPLWLLLLTPVFALTGALKTGSWVGVHLALSLCALLDVASGVLLWRLLRRLGSPRGAHWAAAVWFLSPFTVLLSLRGLEGSLNVTLFAVWLWVVAWVFGDGAPDARRGALVGIFTGLAFLARTDNGPLLGFSVAAVACGAALRGRWSWMRTTRVLVTAGAVTALVASPWFLWNVAVFGTPFQVSGVAKFSNPQLFGHVGPAQGFDLDATLLYLGAFLWTPVLFVAGEFLKDARPFFSIVAVEIAVVSVLTPFLVHDLRHPRAPAQRAVADALVSYLLAHAVVYAVVLRSYVTWYATVPTFILVLFFAGLAAQRPLELLPRWGRVALATFVLLVSVATFAQFFTATKFVPRGEELVARSILTTIARQAPGTRTVGIFNAGAAGYFAPEIGPLTVVNLDGLVNNPAVAAWQAGRYYEYLVQNVDVVVDDGSAGMLSYLLGPGGRPRFDARYPRWSPDSMVYGRRLGAPVR